MGDPEVMTPTSEKNGARIRFDSDVMFGRALHLFLKNSAGKLVNGYERESRWRPE